MTRDEAVRYFKRHIDLYCVEGICREAEEMAIEVLEQEPCEDAISRQAVLDCQRFIYDETGEELEVILAENVLNLPSVTQKSETVTEFADRCRECGAKYGKLLKQQPCEDAISRQAAIDAIYARYIGGKEAVDKAPASDHYAEGIDEAVCAVEDLPSVTPQQKTGRWVKVHPLQADDVGAYMCSYCKVGDWNLKGTEKFCPNCGAKMEEVEE